jgi:putative acetyltransferase
MSVKVRAERTSDHAAVYEINRRAFGRKEEARLVEAVRSHARISLVAEEDGSVVGHILFTTVTVTDGDDVREALGLGPMAVLPESQRRGVGGELVRAGLEACREEGAEVVFVLGHPGYYPRFGFRTLGGTGLHCKYVPEGSPAFMATELREGALAELSGRVDYLGDFDAA